MKTLPKDQVKEAVAIAIEEGSCALIDDEGKTVGVISAPMDKRECLFDAEETIRELRQQVYDLTRALERTNLQRDICRTMLSDMMRGVTEAREHCIRMRDEEYIGAPHTPQGAYNDLVGRLAVVLKGCPSLEGEASYEEMSGSERSEGDCSQGAPSHRKGKERLQ